MRSPKDAPGQGIEVTPATRVRPAEKVLFRQLGAESVLLDLATSTYFGLNEVGTRIWTLVVAGEGLTAVLATLHAEFDVPEDRLRVDVLKIVGELVEHGLLVVEAG